MDDKSNTFFFALIHLFWSSMKSNYRFILACAIPLFLLGPNNVVSAEKSSQQYLAEGNQFLTSGQFNDAVISYDAAIRKFKLK